MRGKLIIGAVVLVVLLLLAQHLEAAKTRSQELTIDANVMSPTFGLPLDEHGNVVGSDGGAP
jgi:hypothetical protein